MQRRPAQSRWADVVWEAHGVVPAYAGTERKLWLRMRNERHIVTFHHSGDGRTWTKFDVQMEVSGYHHNVVQRIRLEVV